MRIVGFQSGAHDVAYCILENGVPIIHEELERLIRIKEPKGDGLKLYFDRVGEDLHVDNFRALPKSNNVYFDYGWSVNLHDDYEGGEFILCGQALEKKKGSAVVFPSNFMFPHEVMEVTSGNRYSVMTWIL